MKHIQKTVSLPAKRDFTSYTPDGKALFLDIETTGLSADRCPVYLVGCCYPEGESWRFHQWFAENPREEAAMLADFAGFARGFSLLIHFNGDHFDLPYLHRRCMKYDISDPFLTTASLDLYKKIKPCKSLLGLPNCKLKTIEAFLGIAREDRYNGGQLIDVYRAYARRPDPEAERLLLLHNEEDILDMPALLSALPYADFLGGRFAVTEICAVEEEPDAIAVTCRLDLPFPRRIFFEEDGFTGMLNGEALRLTFPCFTGELKYFLPNPGDYYYLPAEDTAVHRSVAAFVDKNYRKKATADTAYIRKSGRFVRIPAALVPHTFRPHRGGPCYMEADPRAFTPEFTGECLKRLCCLLH